MKEDNQAVIKALNMYGRVPKLWELLKENQELKEENKQFKDNWDKLKEWLESNWEESQDIWFVKIINKMQELEKGSE